MRPIRWNITIEHRQCLSRLITLAYWAYISSNAGTLLVVSVRTRLCFRVRKVQISMEYLIAGVLYSRILRSFVSHRLRFNYVFAKPCHQFLLFWDTLYPSSRVLASACIVSVCVYIIFVCAPCLPPNTVEMYVLD